MAKLQSTIRALVYDYLSLETLGNKLNKIFHRDSPSKIFASLIYVEIDSESGNVKFINAGHYPPIIARSEKVEQLEKDAPALGLIKEATFNKQLISLEQNDFMIIYSDGLTEAKNGSGEIFWRNKTIRVANKQTADDFSTAWRNDNCKCR
ncbi:MAG: PP2C family protein-serine/threonine phosphatase [Ignavibacteriaceae bacterium]|nr:PP2C family protein-serine/threonine phosphatase [Ignavibacteriaceae bacterium]